MKHVLFDPSLPSMQYYRSVRITRLVEKPRCMTPRAAAIVVDAAMFGIGCLEGEVRKKIQEEQDADTLHTAGSDSSR